MLANLLLLSAVLALLLHSRPTNAEGAAAAAAQLKQAWKSSQPSIWRDPSSLAAAFARQDPTQAILFASCTLSADTTTINGVVCSSVTITQAIGCLATRQAYVCNGSVWLPVVPQAR
jgi:hypothetical protein